MAGSFQENNCGMGSCPTISLHEGSALRITFAQNHIMRTIYIVFLLFVASLQMRGQEQILPVEMTPEEVAQLEWLRFVEPANIRSVPEPPPTAVRTMAEWEELQALAITWRSFPNVLTQIVRHASEEAEVIILCRNQSTLNSAKSQLQASGIALDNVRFVLINNNSVWMRDYGPNCVYGNDVEELYFIDWIYNRPSRQQDNLSPVILGDSLGIPVYEMTAAPYDLVNTGGNFNVDGLGTAFASKLVLDENKPGNIYGAGPHDEQAIDEMMGLFMGLERYIKMETLPYDVIHHIDMHMKLLDEGTLLVGQYPEGVADGPQIEANLNYVLDNFPSSFGKPYRVVRIIQPPDFGGSYPNTNGDYRTYTNSVFVNKTILVPTYETQYDTIALRVYRENFPGYKIVGINANEMIWANGALHCITKEIGVGEPLWIAHDRLDDISDNELWMEYPVEAIVKHKSGVTSVSLHYTTDTLAGYLSLPMTQDPLDASRWMAAIPHQENGSEVFYYISAEASNGKTQVRPLAAPAGYFHFTVDGQATAANEVLPAHLDAIYPNPASAITVVPVRMGISDKVSLTVNDVFGRVVEVLHQGQLPAGEHRFYLRADRYSTGAYFVTLQSGQEVLTRKLVVK
ncbi:MAG: hypothetical protein CMJ42_15075 [Phyllobacteriaceae bacterium]|nr:hypothetical protein [Phyllobacteriaceae bacterium]